ncbi:CCR4-NOT transcription complex [Polyplosphaeria fusca]|uniref:General negative regulator of transcription subunit n=1 Tax=Polyplosphaeria fusca TaxID=682080 RepID=A0A9P4R3K6_9PLEO|nr:CCR4-NOT transcription complex [Polyplosphaeria fusca]
MAARKLQQEIDKCFKKVAEGVQAFEGIYEKIQQTGNPSQKEKLEDALKKEIKKLQRSRDQIKTWATMSEIKDKKPLLDQRKLIETQMEKFKAVEKEMKTKAFSKEGLSLAAKLDPREKEKQDVVEFLQTMNDELDRQVETIEAEVETLQATMKKGKKDSSKAERIAELESAVERHKWHQGKLDLLQRAVENGNVDVGPVKDLEDGIRYYVDQNQDVDFIEDDTMYDEFNLEEEEAMFGMGQEVDRVSSQDTQSIQDEVPEVEPRPGLGAKGKSADASASGTRRSSAQLKSPLPALATLHTPLPGVSSSSANNMKPAPLPTRTPGEPLKYASAAAAAAASDKNGVGIAPLPPPPGAAAAQGGLAPAGARTSATTSPASSHPQPAQRPSVASTDNVSAVHASKSPAATSSIPATPSLEKGTLSRAISSDDADRPGRRTSAPERVDEEDSQSATPPLTNGESHVDEDEEDSVYHLPSSLQDLLDSFEATKNDITAASSKSPDEQMLAQSMATAPDSADTEAPHHYRPQNPYPYTPSHYPQEPLPIFDDARLYSRIETDALFYAFYYRQGTYQQFLAAKALKAQSWRFHKQYQTWFQRHEEPKAITEDYEQGTYRFFDYESTWYVPHRAFSVALLTLFQDEPKES